jgi:NADPH:quinone reductase-like Zn-dependent oxidoreductase
MNNKTMKYKSVVATQRGGPEMLQIVENELRPPTASEVRIKVQATAVGQTDINYRYGRSPLSPKIPFVPGYAILGVVDALDSGVTQLAVGQRVAALTGYGGYTEIIYLGQEHLVPVPDSLAPAEAITLVLNYVTAYQMLHREAKVKVGDKVLLIGASGGVGTALLQLGKLAGLKMYGTASPDKHSILIELGAQPIDYHSQDFVAVIRQAEPDGLDFVFDGMGGEYGDRGMAVLRRGGKLVGYAAPQGLGQMLTGLVKLALTNLLPNGKTATFYGISVLYQRDKQPFKDDLAQLFKLLATGQIHPIVTARFPLLEAAKANELLESGRVVGNIVLLSPELL